MLSKGTNLVILWLFTIVYWSLGGYIILYPIPIFKFIYINILCRSNKNVYTTAIFLLKILSHEKYRKFKFKQY